MPLFDRKAEATEPEPDDQVEEYAHPKIVCWLPGGDYPIKPNHVTLLTWERCLEDMAGLPAWWGYGDDVTAEHEQRMVKVLLRGVMMCDADCIKQGAIIEWRDRCRVGHREPCWDGWAEFEVAELGLHVLYFGPASANDLRQMCLDCEGISETGRLTHWAVRDDAPEEGESLTDYAVRIARREIAAYQKKTKRRGRKAAPKTVQEAGL